MEDIFGNALLDYQNGKYTEDIITYSSLDEKDVLPLPYLFRSFDDMPSLEQRALTLCKGTVLDIGCGSGSHSLYLQQEGFMVTALDNSPGAVKTCRMRGLQQLINADIYSFTNPKFDTLLLLMNGIGIAGHLGNLNHFLAHLRSIVTPTGQILIDSTDIAYMFEEHSAEIGISKDSPIDYDDYYGEVDFMLEYKGEMSASFSWLYLDYATLERAAKINNLNCELVLMGHQYNFLVRLTHK